jgi:hypothetical protein
MQPIPRKDIGRLDVWVFGVNDDVLEPVFLRTSSLLFKQIQKKYNFELVGV